MTRRVRWILAGLLLLGWAAPANALIAHGVGPFYGSIGPGNTYGINTTGLTSGRMLVAIVTVDTASTTVTSVQVAGESDMTAITGATLTSNSNSTYFFALPTLSGGGNKLVTVNLSTSDYSNATVMEYAGQHASPISTAKSVTGGSGQATTTVDTAASNALILTFIGVSDGAAEATNGTNFTLLGTRSNIGSEYSEDGDQVDAGSAGTKTVASGNTNSSSWGIGIATFLSASGTSNKAGGLVNTDPLKSLVGGGLIP